ncbi:MAG TPA: alpha-L-arabinofuranosidase C-terminal domain-containing protein [Bryobacteraceae bacterium]|nr:alpha-L-arabinofuranosidase C-terminal domain-containing protein [Bryobacteraceae bacterium]
MASELNRRQFARTTAAASLAALLPQGVFSNTSAGKKAVVHADDEIGVVRPEFHSHFAEHLGSCVYGGIWVGKNSPVPNVNGFRQAAVDYLKELGVPVLRWPGGCFADDHHWRDGIGPLARRPKRVNTTWGMYTEDNSFGTHEFVAFCRLIGAEPYLAANVGTGSPQEMRDWMEYCNYPSGSTLADERAANGSPEPFRVRYWGVGNELWGCGGNLSPEQAAAAYRQFATFARAFGGLRPYLVGCGPSGNDARWTRGFFDTLAGRNLPSGYSMHYYSNGTMPPLEFTPEAAYTQFNSFPRVEQAVASQRTLLDGYDPGRRIGLFLDEWGVWDRIPQSDEQRNGRLWQQSTMRSAVGAALGLNIFNRLADKLYMCNIAQMVNVLQSVLLTDGPEGKNCVRTTSYYAFLLFKPHRSKTAVRVETDGPKPADFGGRGAGGRGQQQPEPPPDLSLSASRQGSEMVLTFVNPRHDVDMQVDCALRGVSAKSGRAQILHDSDMNACNSFDNPDRIGIKPHEVAVEGQRVRIALPAMSVATVTLQVA